MEFLPERWKQFYSDTAPTQGTSKLRREKRINLLGFFSALIQHPQNRVKKIGQLGQEAVWENWTILYLYSKLGVLIN